MSRQSDQAGINVLPPDLQNRIAAGEVVERPASVLKELVENSLDAAADRVEAGIESGGQGLIFVQDNGEGIEQQELELALTRHATSKISSSQDLQDLSSFGFRGEALPSIASVSRMRISSLARGQDQGSGLEVEFGSPSPPGPAAVRQGTRVEVRDLFLNTPARLKFLKKQSTEARKCQEVMQQIALVNLHCAFRFTSNRREILTFQRDQTLLQRLMAIWPQQITSSMLPVTLEQGGSRISGFVGHPETAQARPDRVLFFVNRRPVQDRLLHNALKRAYSGRLLSREHPQAALFLELPSREVDVNVHPAKSEVRFLEEKAVYSLLHNAVDQALRRIEGGFSPERETGLQEGPAETKDLGAQARLFIPGMGQETLQGTRLSVPGSSEAYSLEREEKEEGEEKEIRREPATESVQLGPDLAYLGQLAGTYLLLKRKEELLVVDQHAAHERVLFSRYTSGGGSPGTQRLALPLRLRLHPSEQGALDKAARNLREMGFALQREDRENLLVSGIPQQLDRSSAGDFLREVLREGFGSLRDMWCLMACRNAVKAGESLASAEALQLVSSWLDCPDRDYCPHGRPVSAQLGQAELEKLFKRGK